MSIEFVHLKFSSANIKLSETPQFLLSTNVPGIIPVNFGSTRQLFCFPKCWILILPPVTLHNDLFLWPRECLELLHVPYIFSNEAGELSLLFKCDTVMQKVKNSPHFANCLYLTLTKTSTVANRICEEDLHLNVGKILCLSRVLITRKRKYKHRIFIQMTAKFKLIFFFFFFFCIFPQECGSL